MTPTPRADDLTVTFPEHRAPPFWFSTHLESLGTPTPPSSLSLCITSSEQPTLKACVPGGIFSVPLGMNPLHSYLFNFWTRPLDFSICFLSISLWQWIFKILSSLNHSPFSLCEGNRFTQTDDGWPPWRHHIDHHGCAILPAHLQNVLEGKEHGYWKRQVALLFPPQITPLFHWNPFSSLCCSEISSCKRAGGCDNDIGVIIMELGTGLRLRLKLHSVYVCDSEAALHEDQRNHDDGSGTEQS